MPSAGITEKFSSVDHVKRDRILQHPESLSPAHIIEISIAADIYEQLFQHRNSDSCRLLQRGPGDKRLDDKSGLRDVYVVIEYFLIRTMKHSAPLCLEAVEDNL